jgi:hypothetical protein
MPRAVGKSAELSRIIAIPRRHWESENINELTARLTKYLKAPGGEMTLRHIQAVALKECYEQKGLFGPIPVGFGKSLVTFLAPILCEAKRPLLLIPAKLKYKTEREMEKYGLHFKMPSEFKIMSYEMLSRDKGQAELLSYKPDMVLSDECHRLKNLKAACTKRIGRWMKDNPDCIFLGVSGTITRKSIMDYAHLLRWALKDNAPIPSGWRETKEWSLALDENLAFDWERLLPGALMLLGTKEEQDAYHFSAKSRLQLGREVYAKRLTETPGVVSVQGSFEGASLSITHSLFKQPAAVKERFKTLRETWQTPDGVDIMEAPVFWAYARQFSCGFYYKWTSKPPKEWLIARKAWAQFVRKAIVNNRRGLDTEFQIAQAVVRGEYDAPEYLIWKDIKDTFKPQTEAVWISDDFLNYCAEWGQKNTGIIWTEHVAFGEKLSEISGIPYYGQQGLNAKKEAIEDAKGTIIASIQSNGEGRNLQQWSNNLITSCPPSAATVEQLLGRTHRHGQEADEVCFAIMMKCVEDHEGFLKCMEQAKYVENSTQQKQKILYSDIEYLDPGVLKTLCKSDNAAWNKK